MRLSDDVFRALLDLFMCSDPYPVACETGHALIDDWLDAEARERGYGNWVVAYHEFAPKEASDAKGE